MALELHTWGPAFGLPSIDAACLASIAFLHNVLPNNSWKLIPDSNPNANPLGELPALRNGHLWIAGFRNIAQYLQTDILEAQNLDVELNESQCADREALFSFLEARGQPLLDLSFYVSSDNYTTCTRGALAEILGWPQSWTIPDRLRDRARKRAEHLGLSALDIDAIREKQLKDQNEGMTAQIPKSLRRPKQTVSALLGSSAQQTRFRQEAVFADFAEPLEARLKGREWLVGKSMSTVDCLALGMLALMLIDSLPQPWLHEMLDTKYSELHAWAKRNSSSLFGLTVTTQTVMSDAHNPQSLLPWHVPERRSWSDLAVDLLDSTIGSIHILRNRSSVVLDTSNISMMDGRNKFERKQSIHMNRRRQQLLRQEFVVAFLSSVAAFGWLVYAGTIVLPRRQPGPARQVFGHVRRTFGEAGSFLGLG